MLNYMRAEFYKLFHRRYLYINLLVLLGLETLLVSGWIFTNSHGNHIDFYNGGVTAAVAMNVGLACAILVGDMVFSEQYKNNTLKNEVAFGIPRTRIYLGKLAVGAITGTLVSLIAIVYYELLCYATLCPSTPERTTLALQIVGYCVAAALPQWLAALSIAFLLLFSVKSGALCSLIVMVILFAAPGVCELLGRLIHPVFLQVEASLPFSMIQNAAKVAGDWMYLAKSWAIGAVWTAASTAVGLALFREREIN